MKIKNKIFVCKNRKNILKYWMKIAEMRKKNVFFLDWGHKNIFREWVFGHKDSFNFATRFMLWIILSINGKFVKTKKGERLSEIGWVRVYNWVYIPIYNKDKNI